MMKYKLLFILTSLFLSGLTLSAQDWEELPSMREIKGKKLLEKIEPKQNGKNEFWGYVDPEGKFVIKPIFTQACPYEGKIARISLQGKWGALNEKGLFQIFPMYQSLDSFSADSLAVCSRSAKFGIVNSRGREIVFPKYDSVEYTYFGYIMCSNGLYGTIDHKGQILLKPQFEKIVELDPENGISHIKKDGKWGLLRDGKEILAIKWDEPVEFLRSGGDKQPDLYSARQNGRLGVVSLYGDYVVPPVYDDIELASSGEYYITMRDRKYGALSLKMVDIVPAIMDSKPYLGENIFKVHDAGDFFCANVNGSIDFRLCADLYQLFKPEEYISTKYFPQWAKIHIIEENNIKRTEALEKASVVCEKMAAYGYDIAAASCDAGLPDGMALSYPQNQNERYGLLKKGVFKKVSEGAAIYRAYEDAENSMSLETDGDDYVIRMENFRFSIKDAVARHNIKEFTGFYPKEYARLSDDLVMVSMAFVRPAGMAGTPLLETDPYMLPVPSFPVKASVGKGDPENETTAILTFSLDSLKSVACHELAGPVSNLLFSSIGGFYAYTGSSFLVDRTSPLRKYDRYGKLAWEYFPGLEEKFYDMEETENFIYLCGSVKEGDEEKPLLRQISKTGKAVEILTSDVSNARYSGIFCNNRMLYLKTDFLKGTPEYGKDYYPMYCLDRMNDNVGVWIKCVWEDWGTGLVGGLGLVDNDGTWLCTPNLSDQISTAFDWEFGAFSDGGEYLVVRHQGNFGLVGRDGSILIDPKYELLEPLANPNYFRVRVDGSYGVVDINDRAILPAEYSFVGNMNEDRIVVSKDGMYGCFDKNGKVVVPLEYEEIREYVYGMARIRVKNRFGFIDKNGEMIVAPFSDEVENFSDGFTLVTIKGKKGFVSLDGDWIAPPMYDAGLNFSGGFAPLAMGGKYGYIDKTGNFVIPMQYDDAREFNAELALACVSNAGKWGVVNTSGNMVLPIDFDKVEICADGYIYVEKDGKCGIYTSRGKAVFEPKFDNIERFKDGRLFRHGVANARLDGNRIRVDSYGNIIHQYSMLTE